MFCILCWTILVAYDNVVVFAGNTVDHTTVLVSKLKVEITTQFNDLLLSASNKITEFAKLDKKAWESLDEEEVVCKKKADGVDGVCDAQVN